MLKGDRHWYSNSQGVAGAAMELAGELTGLERAPHTFLQFARSELLNSHAQLCTQR
jgi:hypothetical protein